MSSDSSDYPPDTDNSDEGDDSDLSHLGAAQTTIKSFTVKQESYQQVGKGHKELVNTVLGSGLHISNPGNADGTVKLPTLGEMCKPDSGSSSTNVIQQNFIQVQQQFGDVTVQGTRNLTIGGTQNIGQPGPAQEERKLLAWTEKLKRRTSSRINRWTKGMVRTSGLQIVIDKLNSGVLWVTIKGSPGEGKTTTAYMALEELQKLGRDVFQVFSPQEFSEIKTTISRPVIMLDDIFGDLEFDQAEWTRWKSVLFEVLGEKEHRSHEKETASLEEEEVTVILTGRDYVLKSAFSGMGRISDYFTQDVYVVNMSNTAKRELKEKHAIWNVISNSSGIELDQETIDKICCTRGPHGFPHVCRLFVTLHKEHPDLDAEQFFNAPLEFLNQTVIQFMQDKEKLFLFKEMIKRDGKVSVRELANVDTNADSVEVANNLVGTYMRREDGWFTFDHPSIYDSVAFILCKHQPLFVITNCNLSFLHERLRLEPPCDTRDTHDNESALVVYIPRCFIIDLAKRFASEISHRNLLQVLSHRAFADAEFTRELISRVTLPLPQLLELTDIQTGNQFLTLAASNKSPQLLMHIKNQTDIQLTADDINSLLYGVCHYAASDILTYLVQTSDKLDINVRYGDMKRTPLMIAAGTRNSQFVHQIISLNPDLSAHDMQCRTVLHYLCRNGLVSAAEMVIDMGVDIDEEDDNYHSSLRLTCETNQMEVIKMLLAKGAMIDAYTAAFVCRKGNMEAVRLLFENGASVNMKTHDLTLLTSACRSGRVEVIKFLIGEGASVNKVDDTGLSPLHRASRFRSEEIITYLLEQGADVDSRNTAGDTLLHIAAENKSKQYVDVLLKARANVNVQNAKDGDTPLHITARRQSTDCVEELLKAGAYVNVQNAVGDTPLHSAANRGSTVSVDKLLKAGADVNAQNVNGNTPLHKASMRKTIGFVDALLKARADVNVQNAVGDTPLHIATWRGFHKLVDMLVKAGAHVNIQNVDGETPLHNAIDREYKERGRTDEAFVEITDMEGQISLLQNPYYGKSLSHHPPYITICQTLINHGACVNKQDSERNTPLHLLCQVNKDTELYHDQSYQLASSFEKVYTALVTFLVDNGADVNIQNNRGEPALREWCQTLFSINEDKRN